MEQKFEVGDTVQLKSGGPTMTVEVVGERYGEETVWCTWFVGTKLQRDTFKPGALQKHTRGARFAMVGG